MPDPHYRQRLESLLAAHDKLHCENSGPGGQPSEQLEAFSHANGELVQETRENIFARCRQLQQAIAEQGRFFSWLALSLFLFSLALVCLFTRMIIGPVKLVENIINRLEEGQALTADTPFSGSREIQSLAQRVVWLNERLVWLESQRHEFLRHISHELKTPLASLHEGAELLADEVAG